MKKKLFFSINCLRSFIFIGAILTLLIGIISIFIEIYAFLMSSIWTQFSQTFRNRLIVAFLLGSMMIILSAVSGLFGIIRKKQLFLTIYTFSILIFMVIFIILGVFSAIYPSKLSTGCINQFDGDQLNQTVWQANATLCKENCQCFFLHNNQYTNSQLETLTNMGVTNFSLTNNTLPIDAQSCAVWNNDTYPMTSVMFIMETFFTCSGWCGSDMKFNLYYLFTNINNGKPVQYCYTSLTNFFKKFGLILLISSFLVSIILILVFINIICLCCHPDRSKDPLRQKLIEL